MPYSIKKTSETVTSLVISSFPTTFSLAITNLTPKTYTWGQATSDVSVSTLDGTITDNGDATYAITAAGTYSITFAEDGVYKLSITITGTGSDDEFIVYAGTYIHYNLSNSELIALLKTQLQDNIYCHPDVAYDCIGNIEAMYNTNILSLLTFTYLASDINVAFDYAYRTSGILYKGYKYECTAAGTGTRDFADDATLLLMDSQFNIIPADTALTLGEIYTCIQTGTPDTWGSTTLAPYTTTLQNRFKLVADAIDRVNEYSESCAVKNICQ